MVAFVLVFAFGLMLVAFRSIVVAAKAIVLNLLSVAAAYGVLVLVFQHGFGKGLLGFSSTAGIDPVVPLLLFVILFGLSMDYHVFIVSRIRERFDRGATMDEAISDGIKSTAGVVTSAAIVMVGVFSIFATLSMLFFKQFGVGLAAAILIDATIVRGVLLPATMKLLGELELVPARAGSSGCPSSSQRRAWSRSTVRAGAGAGAGAGSSGPASAQRVFDARPRSPASSWSRIVVLGLAYLRFASAADTVSVPAGAQAGAADPRILQLRHRERQLRRRLRHARRAREPARRGLAPDRAAGHPDPRPLGAPGRADLPAPGRPRDHEHDVPEASRFADHHDVVLVGYRGVDGSSRLDCPEVDVGAEAPADFLGQKSFRAYARLPGLRRAAPGRRRRPRRLHAARAGRRSRGRPPGARLRPRSTSSARAPGTRTAMIYAWRYPAASTAR